MIRFPEVFRIAGETDKSGMFRIPYDDFSFNVVASNEFGWEHVSVSLLNRCPTWQEMCVMKDVFWDEEDLVMQLHPPKSENINNCPTCLHLWRPLDDKIPTPPSIMVGIK